LWDGELRAIGTTNITAAKIATATTLIFWVLFI
jgi:hypothetical protein